MLKFFKRLRITVKAIPLAATDMLEVGARYRNRMGDTVVISDHKPSQGLFTSFGYDYRDNTDRSYRHDGRVFDTVESDFDIVERLV